MTLEWETLMRKLVFAGLAFGALIMPAMAADMNLYKAPPPAPYFTWTGFYLGGDVGGAFTSDNATWVPPRSNCFQVALVCESIPVGRFGPSAAAGGTGGSGFAGGLLAGYNYQIAPSWVAGIEGDWTGMRAGGSVTEPWSGRFTAGGTTTMSSEVEWAATLRGRLGYLIWPNLLAYGTGGAAWGKIQYGASAVCCGTFNGPFAGYSAGAAFDHTAGGWVAGGGLEWAPFAGFGLLLRVEYLYFDFSSAQNVVVASNAFTPSSFTWSPTTMSVTRFGMAFKF
jgi:outer membrane immunogenic protein